MFVLVTHLCLAFSGADIKCDFVLMTSAYSQYVRERDSCIEALVGSRVIIKMCPVCVVDKEVKGQLPRRRFIFAPSPKKI